ncbi:MAG: long-chain fatty acid--CoA ligase [Bacteroidota bacterium]|nr:long-chain fatty acid--CoA ligase [Bacteroidota bacterium]
METVKRLFDLLPHYKQNYLPKDDVIARKEDGKWKKYSIDEYIAIVNDLSYGFLYLGIEKGDKIATIASNRPEWNFVDMAALQVGAVHVPVYPTISESDYKYILTHAEIKYIFISGVELYRKIEHILSGIPTLKSVFTFKEDNDIAHYSEIIRLGKEHPDAERLQRIKDSIDGNDLATLIYTSGTTGNPKGVMLSHTNILSNCMAVAHISPVGQEGKALSFLPLCHVYERMLTYVWHLLGISIYYVENIATISENMTEIKPDLISTVPRLLEKIYDKIFSTGQKLKGFKRFIFFWALRIALHYKLDGKNGWYYEFKRKIADKLVYSKWRAAVGNNVKTIISGGAALQPRLLRMFWAAGIPVLEGYGLTETSPVIAVNALEKGKIKFGTVGTPPATSISVKIADDDEILCKGPNVMLGYYKEPGLTNDAIDAEGWFHTGDTGMIEEGKFLKITGRKKSIFKTSMGKYISPELLENKLKESRFIDNILVVGEHQKFAGAIIVPDFAFLRSYCEIKGIKAKTPAEMIVNKQITQRIRKEVASYNKHFGAYEQIKKFELIDHEWSIETGEITPSLKIKRAVVCERYKELIDKIFSLPTE